MKADLNRVTSRQKSGWQSYYCELSCWSLGASYKAPGSCFHLHPLEGVTFSSLSVCQDVPCPPVDSISYPAVAPMIIPPIQVGRQAGVEPPACAIVMATVPTCVPVVVSVSGAEGSAIMIVSFAVAQCIACITRVFPCCQTIPGRNHMWHIGQMVATHLSHWTNADPLIYF